MKANFLITYKALKQKFGLKLEDAAEDFGVSRSTLKRICRLYDVPRWPSHKRVKANHSTRIPCKSHLTSFNPTPKQDLVPLVSGKQGPKVSSHILIKIGRLAGRNNKKTETGTFMVKYLDEDGDWILITCDTDLGNCIAAAVRSLDKTVITMSIQPVPT